MKMNILLILFAFVSFTYSANAQSCCSSKKKGKSACSKKTAVAPLSSTNADVKPLMASSIQIQPDTTVSFTVYGNCGMCEKTIEGSLKDVKSVTFADWDKETDQMKVTFISNLITLDEIKQIIADVGYDSDTHRAKEDIYLSLPGCCQYERPTN